MTTTDIEPTTVTELATTVRNESLDRAARLGMWLAAAESGSKDPKALGMAAALRISYADSLGLPAHAASEVYIINGNLTLSAKLCRALAHNHGIRVTKENETGESVTAVVWDANDREYRELGRYTFTVEMARQAGLSGANWTKNTGRMLWARASKRALDDFAPYVTVGILSSEEAEEVFDAPAEPFDSDEVLHGEVVE